MTDFSGIRVVVVAHGPPLKGGIATVALDLVEDPVLNAEFEIVFQNTSQNDEARGKFALGERAAGVHRRVGHVPPGPSWRGGALALGAGAVVDGVAPGGDRRRRPPAGSAGRCTTMRSRRTWSDPASTGSAGSTAGRSRRLAPPADANILIAAAGEPNIRPYMPTVARLPVVHNSAVVDDMVRSSVVHDPPVVLFIGELLERKGLVTLLDALDQLDARGSVTTSSASSATTGPGSTPTRTPWSPRSCAVDGVTP